MIYFITDGEFVKIGFTAFDDAASRVDSLQTGNARELVLLGTIPGNVEDETFLHKILSDFRMRGEWFNLNALSIIENQQEILSTIEYKCNKCGRKFNTVQALNAHIGRWCKA